MGCFTPPLIEVSEGEWFVHNAPSNLVLLFCIMSQYQDIDTTTTKGVHVRQVILLDFV